MKKLLTALAVALLTVAAFGQFHSPYAPVSTIPAYHNAAPSSPQPPILSGKQLDGPVFQYAWQRAVYRDAAKISKALYQMPCYCRCDIEMGHTSLRSCFQGLHGAECSTCSKEAYYTYKMTREGRSIQQIRSGIEHGDYEKIELSQIH